MNRYGRVLTAFGTASAPHLATCECTSYSYDDGTTRYTDPDEIGDMRALVLHSPKAQLSFGGKVSSGTTDFLDLSTGAAITVSGISVGTVLARRTVERWALGQPKTINIEGTHYPDVTQVSPAAAGVDVDAFVPDQSGLSIVYPGGELIWGTFGLSHASGVLHMLELTQELSHTEDDPTPAGLITGVASHGYMRTAQLELLSTAAAPSKGSVLAITGAPDRAGGYRIETVRKRFENLKGMMLAISAVWIPPFG